MTNPSNNTGLLRHIRHWGYTRNYRRLLFASPALLVVGGLLLSALSVEFASQQADSTYLIEGKAALSRNNVPRALCCFERLIRSGHQRSDVDYHLALAAERSGQLTRAVRLMVRLASPDKLGYAPAHYWIAQQLLKSPQQSASTRNAAENHLVLALEGGIEQKGAAHGLLGQLYLVRGRHEDAQQQLQLAVKSNPIFRSLLARVFENRGEGNWARKEAELAVDASSKLARMEPDNHPARLIWSDALIFQNEFPTALEVLKEGLASNQEELYRVSIARLYLSWYERRKLDKEASEITLLQLVQKGLEYQPDNRLLLDRLMLALGGSTAAREKARSIFEGMISSGKGAVFGHFGLSVDALRTDKKQEAARHLESAHRLAPNFALVANNLAWLITESPNPDLPRALRLVNVALKQEPDNFRFLETRGVIQVKLGRWKEALSDLEPLITRVEEKGNIHRNLSMVYRNLGYPELAEEHHALSLQAGPRKE